MGWAAPAGTSGLGKGLSDHHSPSALAAWRGSGAPAATHASSRATSSAARGCFGGIWWSASAQRTIRIRRLSSGFPGTIAGPVSPPCSQPDLASKVRPPFIFPAACE